MASTKQLDLFTYYVAEASFKQELTGFDLPLFSLSKKPDMSPFYYQRENYCFTIKPSSIGRATQFDKDILIYAVSQLVQAKNQGHPVTNKVRLIAHQLLEATKRGSHGRAYERLAKAGERLRGTVLIEENLNLPDTHRKRKTIFGFLQSFSVEEGPDGRMLAIEIELNSRTVEAIQSNSVLTMDERYFDLTSALDRRMYEVIRKGHGTNKPRWEIGVDKLQGRVGSNSQRKEFVRMLKTRIEKNLIPGYDLELDGEIVKTVKVEALDLTKRK